MASIAKWPTLLTMLLSALVACCRGPQPFYWRGMFWGQWSVLAEFKILLQISHHDLVWILPKHLYAKWVHSKSVLRRFLTTLSVKSRTCSGILGFDRFDILHKKSLLIIRPPFKYPNFIRVCLSFAPKCHESLVKRVVVEPATRRSIPMQTCHTHDMRRCDVQKSTIFV